MTIYGSGYSRSRELTVSVSAKFSAAAGQVKMIFLDLTLPVERIEIRRAGRTIDSGIQINGAGSSLLHRPGCTSCRRSARRPRELKLRISP
jgi:hypothetical protein